MNPIEFKSRYTAIYKDTPAHLKNEVGSINTFEKSALEKLKIDSESLSLLITVGFPKNPPPMLDFDLNDNTQFKPITDLGRGLSDDFSRYLLFGYNNYGDLICIDTDSNFVVYINHDCNNKIVFINSSVSKFAQSICIYAETLKSKDFGSFLTMISSIDPPAAGNHTMWSEEHEMLSE